MNVVSIYLYNYFRIDNNRNPIKKILVKIILFTAFIFAYDLVLTPILHYIFSVSEIRVQAPKKADEFIIFALLIAPITEELIFRLPLSQKLGHFILGSVLAFILVLAIKSLFVKIVVTLFFILSGMAIWNRYLIKPKYIIIASALSFASIHLGNYNYSHLSNFVIFVPILISSQFVFGILSALLRSHGIIYCIAFHAIYNSLLFGVSKLFDI